MPAHAVRPFIVLAAALLCVTAATDPGAHVQTPPPNVRPTMPPPDPVAWPTSSPRASSAATVAPFARAPAMLPSTSTGSAEGQ